MGIKEILENHSWDNFTLLLISAKYNNLETFKLLLNKGCNINATCTKMQNCMHYAVINKNKEFIWFIALYDADKDTLRYEPNVWGQTPIELDS